MIANPGIIIACVCVLVASILVFIATRNPREARIVLDALAGLVLLAGVVCAVPDLQLSM